MRHLRLQSDEELWSTGARKRNPNEDVGGGAKQYRADPQNDSLDTLHRRCAPAA